MEWLYALAAVAVIVLCAWMVVMGTWSIWRFRRSLRFSDRMLNDDGTFNTTALFGSPPAGVEDLGLPETCTGRLPRRDVQLKVVTGLPHIALAVADGWGVCWASPRTPADVNDPDAWSALMLLSTWDLDEELEAPAEPSESS